MSIQVKIPAYKLTGLSTSESRAYITRKLHEAKIPVSTLGTFVRTGTLTKDRCYESQDIIYTYAP